MVDLLENAGNPNHVTTQRIQKYVDFYAQEGLRTLILAKRVLDRATYEAWNQE
jgi:hypothetical protein